MFKAAAGVAALLAVATTVSTVSFESDGVRVGTSVVKDSTLQLRETEGGAVLASANCVESLTGGTAVSVGGERSITIEPGVRLTRVENGWRLSTHGSATLSLTTASGAVSVPSPAVVTASETGWTLATGETLEGTELAASIPVEAYAGNLPDAVAVNQIAASIALPRGPFLAPPPNFFPFILRPIYIQYPRGRPPFDTMNRLNFNRSDFGFNLIL